MVVFASKYGRLLHFCGPHESIFNELIHEIQAFELLNISDLPLAIAQIAVITARIIYTEVI